MLIVNGVTKRFISTIAVRDATVTAGRGLTALLGPNGAGKSTLLRMAATSLVPDSGRVSIAGHDPSRDLAAARASLGFLPQEYGLYPRFTVRRFLDYVALLRGLADREDRARAVADAIGVADLEERADDRISRLSGGMRRRVGLATAVLDRPPVVLLDEPFVGLDPHQRAQCASFLAEIAEDAAVVVSTHQTDDIVAFFERVLILDRGVLVFDGTPAALVERAEGHVWVGEAGDPSMIARPAPDGRLRHIGNSPPSARSTVSPSLEDGYLFVLGLGRS